MPVCHLIWLRGYPELVLRFHDRQALRHRAAEAPFDDSFRRRLAGRSRRFLPRGIVDQG